MATGYIVWDSKNKRMVGGPFLTSPEATQFATRVGKKTDSRESDKKSKDQQGQYTIESVTLN